MSETKTERRQMPVFMLNNVNGSFSLAFNDEFRRLLSDASKEYLALEKSPVVSAFDNAMGNLKGTKQGVNHVKYVEVRDEEKQWQPSMFILVVVNGSFFLSCNGSFGRVLLDIVDASGDEEGSQPLPLYALGKSLDKQIYYKDKRRTGTDG